MNRLLFFAAIAAIVYLLLKSYRNQELGENPPARAEGHDQAEDMVRCIYCGVHLPKSESLMADSKYFCCDAHRRAFQPPPSTRDAG